MKILHYLIGVPPIHRGGLVKYAMDLAEGEKEFEDEVSLLYPACKRILNKKIVIKKTKAINGIEAYEIYNALPLPIDGIENIEDLMQCCDKNAYIQFLKNKEFDIIHIHSFMGLHREFLLCAHELGIPIVYTTHDYFGLCLQSNLFYKGKVCCDQSGRSCPQCCNDFKKKKKFYLSMYKKIIQYKFFEICLQNKRVVALAGQISGKIFERPQRKVNVFDSAPICKKEIIDELRNYYIGMFALIDMFLFNSEQTAQVFRRYVPVRNGNIIDITHKSIRDNREKKVFGKTLKISYLGTLQEIKGFYLLKEVLDEVYKSYKDFILNVYFVTKQEKADYINYHPPYSYDKIRDIMMQADIIVVPSLCLETFGLVVKEAISFGVPCILTENVGAKKWIERLDAGGIIVKANKESLLKAIVDIYMNRGILNEMNKKILQVKYDFSFEKHVREIRILYNALKQEDDK